MNKKNYITDKFFNKKFIFSMLKSEGITQTKMGLYWYLFEHTDILNLRFNDLFPYKIKDFSLFNSLSWNEIVARLK